LLFAACAALVPGALRRLGIPRGTASVAALLFAVHPAALDTQGLTVGQESLFATGLSLASLRCLPHGVRRRRSALPSVVLAFLAFLAKEESYLLPVLAFAAGARFRLAHARAGLRAAWPIAATLGVVVAMRFALLGTFGGYRGPLGTSLIAERAIVGPVNALAADCPARFFLPMRPWPGIADDHPLRHAIAFVPAVLLALGAFSKAAARGVPRGLAIVALGLAPVAAMQPIGEDMKLARGLFLPSLGISVVAAALLAGSPLGRRGRWVAVAALSAASLAVGRADFQAWTRSGAILDAVMTSARPKVRPLPPNAHVLVRGLPRFVDGALCFAPWGVESIAQSSDRFDVTVAVPEVATGVGAFDLVLERDPATSEMREVRELRPERRIARGETLHLPVATPPGECAQTPLLRWPKPESWLDPWYYVNGRIGEVVALPALDVPPGAEIVVENDGVTKTLEGSTMSFPAFVSWFRDGRLERKLIGSPVRLPDDVSVVRIEIWPFICPTRPATEVAITAR
ncbi:MAG TPA: hypothetical protein VKE69_01300, partial [Planctomycetota bacterium]|nr:hypothetical protein [Planctomycetota bacterium]